MFMNIILGSNSEFIRVVCWEVNVLEEKKNIPEPERTSEGKYRCKADKKEFDSREDYEGHCMEEHSSENKW
jgi:hypothetical protein